MRHYPKSFALYVVLHTKLLMRNSKRVKLILSLIIIAVIFIISRTFEISQEDYEQGTIETYKNIETSGKIISKFRDYDDHSYLKVIIEEENRENTLLFNLETGGLYDYLKINDSIVKERGTLDMRIIREDLDTTITMTFK